MSKPSVVCKEVTGQVRDFGLEHPEEYRASEPLQLVQWWEGAGHMPDESGLSYVGYNAEGLCFYVCLEDSNIYTQARSDNEKLWTLGDVVEFFVKPGEIRDDYWEIHVSPNDLIMDIHIPSRDKYMNNVISWDEVVAADSGSTKRVQVIAAENTWTVELCIPWAAFGFETVPVSGTVWQFAVCRYNYSGDLESLELSATAHFTELDFHRYEEYTDLIFG
ncbi:MAG: carbohydrate-binding family 9-like protein [Anaerolineae bacterium]